jgi:hypothetical protein
MSDLVNFPTHPARSNLAASKRLAHAAHPFLEPTSLKMQG